MYYSVACPWYGGSSLVTESMSAGRSCPSYGRESIRRWAVIVTEAPRANKKSHLPNTYVWKKLNTLLVWTYVRLRQLMMTNSSSSAGITNKHIDVDYWWCTMARLPRKAQFFRVFLRIVICRTPGAIVTCHWWTTIVKRRRWRCNHGL